MKLAILIVITFCATTANIYSQNRHFRYTVTGIGVLDPALPYSYAYSINDRGQVVGISGYDGNGDGHAFLWENGDMTDLGALTDYSYNSAQAINNRGQVVGYPFNFPGTQPVWPPAFLWQNGSVKTLLPANPCPAGECVTQVGDINERGDVIGYGTGSDGDYVALMWARDGVQQLGSFFALALNDHDWVVGSTRDGHAALWRDGVLQDLGTLGGATATAYAINNRGQVVGASETLTGETHAFLWEDGTMCDLGTFPGDNYSQAMSINDEGEIVGLSGTGGSSIYRYHPLLWDHGAMYDLDELTLRDSGWDSLGGMSLDIQRSFWKRCGPQHINNRGQIVGCGSVAGETHARAYILTPHLTRDAGSK